MLDKFGYMQLTHPQKNMPIYIDVLKVVAIQPYIYQETASYDKDGNEILDQAAAEQMFADGALITKHVFHFVMTTVILEDRQEINVKERPRLVAKRMAALMEAKDD